MRPGEGKLFVGPSISVTMVDTDSVRTAAVGVVIVFTAVALARATGMLLYDFDDLLVSSLPALTLESGLVAGALVGLSLDDAREAVLGTVAGAIVGVLLATVVHLLAASVAFDPSLGELVGRIPENPAGVAAVLGEVLIAGSLAALAAVWLGGSLEEQASAAPEAAD